MALSSVAGRTVAAESVADEHATAVVLARDGAAAYKDGQYVDALARFEKAFGMVPSPALALNLSHTEFKLGDCDRAFMYADRYAATFTPDSAAGMETPEHCRAVLAAKCPDVEIISDPPGATLAVRGAVTTAHVLPWRGHLPAGHLQLTATLAGHEDAHADLDVREGVPARANLRLGPLDAVLTAPLNLPAEPPRATVVTVLPPVAPPQSAPAVPPDAVAAAPIPPIIAEHSVWRTVGWAALATGAAALIVGTGLGVASASGQATLKTKASPNNATFFKQANAEGQAANALFAVGGAVAAGGVVLVVVFP